MKIDEDMMMWTTWVHGRLVIVTAYLISISCGTGVLQQVKVTANVL